MSTPPDKEIPPPKVDDHYEFWNEPPPALSLRCQYWERRIRAGWKPNRRIKGMGYDSTSEWFGVYIWEYMNILLPLLYPDWK